MTKYRQRVPEVDATPWSPANADRQIMMMELELIEDRGLLPDDRDDLCGQPWNVHGWFGDPVDGNMVCPGDYKITDKYGQTFVQARADFEAGWERTDAS